MKIFNLPRNAKMQSSYRSVTIRRNPYEVYRPDEQVFTGMNVWLEFTIGMLECKSLISEIDISSNSRFYSYDKSDLPWLLYAEPHRITHRQPDRGEIVQVQIDNLTYNAAIEIEDINHLHNQLQIRVVVLQLYTDISTQETPCLKHLTSQHSFPHT